MLNAMQKDDIKTRLENLNLKEVTPRAEGQKIKLAIISSKKSLSISLWLLSVPFILFFSAMLEPVFHILVPPWSLLKAYGHLWPQWVRIAVFATVVIIIPLIAAGINLLAIVWFDYDRKHKVFHIAIRVKLANIIILLIAGVLALLFIGHSIADSLAGHN